MKATRAIHGSCASFSYALRDHNTTIISAKQDYGSTGSG
jgi:hypothetical protein